MLRPSGRQILDFPIGEFGRNAERDGGKSRDDGGCKIDGNRALKKYQQVSYNKGKVTVDAP